MNGWLNLREITMCIHTLGSIHGHNVVIAGLPDNDNPSAAVLLT